MAQTHGEHCSLSRNFAVAQDVFAALPAGAESSFPFTHLSQGFRNTGAIRHKAGRLLYRRALVCLLTKLTLVGNNPLHVLHGADLEDDVGGPARGAVWVFMQEEPIVLNLVFVDVATEL